MALFRIPIIVSFFLASLLFSGWAIGAEDQARLNLIPWPKAIQVNEGSLQMADGGKIVADGALQPLAQIVADEMKATTGVTLAPADAGDGAGGIVLKIDDSLKGEQYTLEIGDRATVAGGNYQAVAEGTTTLLQLATKADGKISLPHVAIKDEPAKAFRGVMIDVAREENSIADLKRCVVMCRLFKIRYMQLHLTDDQAWTVPSKAFPKLGSANHGIHNSTAKVYPLDELVGLVKFADERGITIIPELDVPGHTDALRIPYPEIFDSDDGPAHMGLVDMTSLKAYSGLETLIGESCEIFKSSPYFHIGCDEANLARCKVSPSYAAYMSNHQFTDPYQLYASFIVKLDEIVKKNGKQTMVWGDFDPSQKQKVAIPQDVIAMAWRDETNIKGYLKNGYSVVNAIWTPLYVVGQTPEKLKNVDEDAGPKHRPETIYNWNVNLFNKTQVEATDQILGGQICAWEEGGPVQVDALKPRVSAMGERLWNPDAGKTFADFHSRYEKADELLGRLLTVIN